MALYCLLVAIGEEDDGEDGTGQRDTRRDLSLRDPDLRTQNL